MYGSSLTEADTETGTETDIAADQDLPPGYAGHRAEAAADAAPRRPHVTCIRGHDAVLDHQPLLAALADRNGMAGAMDQLVYFLSASRVRAKVPHLFLLSQPREKRGESNTEPYAAVLLYQYRLPLLPTRVFIASDFGGQRTVLAPEALRCEAARHCAEFLIRRGALLVQLSVGGGDFSPAAPAMAGRRRSLATTYAYQTRTILRTLELKADYEETLAAMGHDTRRNFKRHTRKVDETFGVSFVPHAELSEAEFLALNRASAFPVPTSIALWRFHEGRRFPGSIFVGLRGADGRWLSVLGGRRHRGLTDVDWQFNLAELQKYSMVTAMRAHLMRHEIEQGTRWLRFDGGTAHSMHLSFLKEEVADLLFTRRFLPRSLLCKRVPRLLPPTNLLANVLNSEGLTWHR